jgi:hypothetical protein
MFSAGDIVRFHNPGAGKVKFHLCLGKIETSPLFAFLYLNSKSGYRGDYILEDGQIAGLPNSKTGQTIVSFSLVIRIREKQLEIFNAVKTGAIDGRLAGELAAFAQTTAVLTSSEKRLVVSALETLF